MRTQGDLDAFAVQQEAALKVCDAKREAVVAIVDGSQEKPKKRRWPW